MEKDCKQPLQVTKTCIKSLMSSNLSKIQPLTVELGALENYPIDLYYESDVSMLACLFLIESSSKILVLKIVYNLERGLMLGTFRLLTLESLGSENIIALLLEN